MSELKNKKSWLICFILVIGILVIALCCCMVYIWKMNNTKTDIEEVQNQTQTYSTTEKNLIENNNVQSENEKIESSNFAVDDLNNISNVLGYVDGLEFSDASKISKEDLLYTVMVWHYKEGKVELENTTSAETINKIIKQVYNIDYNYKASYKWQEAEPGIMTYIGINEIKEEEDTYEVEYVIVDLIDADAPDETRDYYRATFTRNSEGNLYIKSNVKIDKF